MVRTLGAAISLQFSNFSDPLLNMIILFMIIMVGYIDNNTHVFYCGRKKAELFRFVDKVSPASPLRS
jgi:hypothetical protein